jgi:NADH-quinone oxidoreductase subunit J
MFYLHLYLPFFQGLLDLYTTAALFFTLMVVYSANAVYAILFLIGIFLITGFLFILLGAEYLGLVLMIVYVGAIAILFLFVLMLLDLRNLMKQQITASAMFVFGLSMFLLTEGLLYFFCVGPFFVFPETFSLTFAQSPALLYTGLPLLSFALYNIYVYYVIGCGMLLLFVMLCVVVLLSQASFSVQASSPRQNKLLQQYTSTVRSAQNN